jgi:hypothetical protein
VKALSREDVRQTLIAEYRVLRDAGRDPARRAVLLSELQAFELGWPLDSERDAPAGVQPAEVVS